MPQYNPYRLHKELTAAGIPVIGVSSQGRVDTDRELTPAEQERVKAILAAHDPSIPTASEAVRRMWEKADVTMEEILEALWLSTAEDNPGMMLEIKTRRIP